MSRTLQRWSVVLCLSALSACGGASDDDGTGPSEVAVCDRPVALTVVRADTLTVWWRPVCRVNQIVFHEPGPWYSSPWLAFAPSADSNPIVPPVKYGVLPPGTIQLVEPQPLEPGKLYFVDLSVTDSTGTNGLRAVAHDSLIF